MSIDDHKPDFPKSEEQASSEVHQENREMAEQRLRRLAETVLEYDALDSRSIGLEKAYRNVVEQAREILSHYREPQA